MSESSEKQFKKLRSDNRSMLKALKELTKHVQEQSKITKALEVSITHLLRMTPVAAPKAIGRPLNNLEKSVVLEMKKDNQRIVAIKYVRGITGLGLKACLQVVNEIGA